MSLFLPNNFNFVGRPLDDRRLKFSGKTSAGKVQYRILRDSFIGMIPAGQSISRPKSQNENIDINFGIYGDVREGRFQRPIAEFRNTENYDLFDRFNFVVMRDYIENDGTQLDLYDHSILILKCEILIEFSDQFWNKNFTIKMYKESPNQYYSNTIFISTDNQVTEFPENEFTLEIHGNFLINMTRNCTFSLGKFNSSNDELLLDIKKCIIKNGSSEYYYNDILNSNIPKLNISSINNILILGGYT